MGSLGGDGGFLPASKEIIVRLLGGPACGYEFKTTLNLARWKWNDHLYRKTYPLARGADGAFIYLHESVRFRTNEP